MCPAVAAEFKVERALESTVLARAQERRAAPDAGTRADRILVTALTCVCHGIELEQRNGRLLTVIILQERGPGNCSFGGNLATCRCARSTGKERGNSVGKSCLACVLAAGQVGARQIKSARRSPRSSPGELGRSLYPEPTRQTFDSGHHLQRGSEMNPAFSMAFVGTVTQGSLPLSLLLSEPGGWGSSHASAAITTETVRDSNMASSRMSNSSLFIFAPFLQ